MKSTEILREKKFIIVFLLLLLIGFVYIMKPFLMAMLLAGILVVLFYPLYAKLNAKLGNRKRLSSLIMTFLILFMIILPAGLIVTILVNQVYAYVGILNLKEVFANLFSTDFYASHIAPFLFDLETKYQIKINIFGVLTDFGKQAAKYVGAYSPTVLLGTANFIFNFLIMLAGIFFLFVDGPALTKTVLDISPLREKYDSVLTKRLKNTIDASIHGYLVTGLLMSVIAAFTFAIVGLDSYVILGTLTFFMSMVPLIGAAGVWIPVCIWLFLQGQTWEGVVVILGGGVVTFIDYFLKPIIIEGKTKIHPLLIFFSLFGGIAVVGILGILFGPVITALLIAMINIYREEFV